MPESWNTVDEFVSGLEVLINWMSYSLMPDQSFSILLNCVDVFVRSFVDYFMVWVFSYKLNLTVVSQLGNSLI